MCNSFFIDYVKRFEQSEGEWRLENRLFLTTDGLLECPHEPYLNPINIYNSFFNTEDQESIWSMLKNIKKMVLEIAPLSFLESYYCKGIH